MSGDDKLGDLDRHLGEIDEQGFTIFRRWLSRDLTAAVRAFVDDHIGPVGSAETSRNDLRHPLPGDVFARLLIENPQTLELARCLLGGTPDLRMREQVIIRSDPEPAPWASELGYHIDAGFNSAEFAARPRQVYYQMLHYCNTVQPGGAAVHIVPRSHTFSYEQVFGPDDGTQRPIESNTSGVGHREDGIEICGDEGDLIVFNPLCFHAASPNRTEQARYAYFTSYYDVSATRLVEFVRRTGYRDGFPDSLRDGLPSEMRSLLEH